MAHFDLAHWRVALLSSLGLLMGQGFVACGGTSDGGTGLLRAEQACGNSVPKTDPGGQSGGFEVCAGGPLHRPSVGSCSSKLPRQSFVIDISGQTAGDFECTTDADCAASEHGYCSYSGGQILATRCYSGCIDDTDCGAGHICECDWQAGLIGECKAAQCTTDADCPSGLCAPYLDSAADGCATLHGGFACITSLDQCLEDEDCGQTERCRLVDGARMCVTFNPCVIGRPFLVTGVPRLAPTCVRDDWQAAMEPDTRLPVARRRELARRWIEVARMEHASVAAFARFALELLSLGAPADLLSDCQQAMADEIAHAKIAFGLASAYGDAPLGPDQLPIHGALEAVSLESAVVNAIIEGCIGETIAAIEAHEAAALAGDPVVRNALRRIASDELKHAALAWRFLRWAIEQDAALAATVECTLANALSDAREQCRESDDRADGWLWRHGFVPESDRTKLRLEVLRNVVEPCAAELLRVLCGQTRGASQRAA